MGYYKTYIQMEQEGSVVYETINDFGIYATDIPFRPSNEVQDVFSRVWRDEDGDDEYIPPTGLKMKSYKINMKFSCKGDRYGVNDSIIKFINYLKQGSMKIYDEYTKIGRRGVRLLGLNDNATLSRSEDEDILVFTVSLKVNDPITDIRPKYINGEIIDLV